MMDCHEAARLISERKDHRLPWRRVLELRLHLVMCRMCVTYHRQLDLLTRVSRRAGEIVLSASPLSRSLSPAARQRIKDRLSSTR
ncbi:MAG: hypothetical protein OEO21_03675 [Candidatus Krumholzibacteria bacterium]|nr:hypothetical protein [Candidatus Krumholzibacteria bacterium]